jgi:hypothetical protein
VITRELRLAPCDADASLLVRVSEGYNMAYGIYPHATHDSRGVVCETGPESRFHVAGYVVREVSGAMPYGRMMPVRQYDHAKLAQKFADKLNARHVW